ncbi:PEP-CTERM sorting domain-containing protein [Nitrosovibrio sp. Nv17]|uniref:PEP-CTERM sorting domain-containing protein n=1 Tax=Nitrosovibrio sp. Nv17 TaxID=1855339 RepID=UPI000908E5F0|nr:PEP-CTERM sorting domain-containing protein [Nitrosovibrio sp. Nv17]SFW38959.1 MYXO-CTERM domain-containing protein [Nitrosovibrio sp. Nv17]
MKMNLKLKAVAVAAIMAASAPALAAIEIGNAGNGELLLNVRYYGGTSATNGDDDISGLFDLGVRMNDFIALNGQAGVNRSWDLTQGAYADAWNTVTSFVAGVGGDINKIEFNVIALDYLTAPTPTYLTTFSGATFPGLVNQNLRGFQNIGHLYLEANAERGTHGTAENGASTSLPTDPTETYFGALNGFGQGDNWIAKTTADTTKALGVEQNFWLLDTINQVNAAQVRKTPFGVDLDGNGSINGNEFSKFVLNADGVLTFTSPVPEADTWAMLLAGLGMLGAIVRRRTGA